MTELERIRKDNEKDKPATRSDRDVLLMEITKLEARIAELERDKVEDEYIAECFEVPASFALIESEVDIDLTEIDPFWTTQRDVPADTPTRFYCGPYLTAAKACLRDGSENTAAAWMWKGMRESDPPHDFRPVTGTLFRVENGIEYVDVGDLTRSDSPDESDPPPESPPRHPAQLPVD